MAFPCRHVGRLPLDLYLICKFAKGKTVKKLVFLFLFLVLFHGCHAVPHSPDTHGSFRYAIKAESYVTAYFDHGDRTDWNCRSKTYNGHKGTDFGIGSWDPMDAGVDIYAADDGVVLVAVDGKYDRCEGRYEPSQECTGSGNYVKLQHADGTITYYIHLKKWSVLVSAGQQVKRGQKLGQVGSSGHSTGPHLHFQINSPGIDPFAGPCSGSKSYWTHQGEYNGLPSTE